ncbi:response regulator [Erythrobacter sp. EC-HK427]|uniref:response regulator n=1 Tax=Erythrobacter sp. EC-HK427 TaxID=2038396 RepID=UPI001257F5A3|nr:response regulator [Erythrobacter sp. EC-HK427]VVT17845.1 conserved hypothetical protein [Erythrobacter sp. EC-HK427]
MAYILIVDDDDIVAEHAANILTNAGHGCGWVNSTKAAAELLVKRKPDLILLDQNMPRENGSALLRRLRNSPRLYDIPVIMLTAVTAIREEQIAYYHGAQDYIRKPFSEKMLLFRVRQMLKARQIGATQRHLKHMPASTPPAIRMI